MAEYVTEWGESVADFTVREEVVRCRDCERFVSNIHGSYCKKSISTTSDPDGFCSWATRKESE